MGVMTFTVAPWTGGPPDMEQQIALIEEMIKGAYPNDDPSDKGGYFWFMHNEIDAARARMQTIGARHDGIESVAPGHGATGKG